MSCPSGRSHELAAYAMPAIPGQPELVAPAFTSLGGTSTLVAALLGAALRRRPVRAPPPDPPSLRAAFRGARPPHRPTRLQTPGTHLTSGRVARLAWPGLPPWPAAHVVEVRRLAVVREETPDEAAFRRPLPPDGSRGAGPC
ncbi:hypothetical protein GCM10010302_29500 [Streptomyces polychromogenes]|uniref:Uncharacterized protein n=1 Tax=Streptomyces polychromogenes TaxID=67342 RepID=A0ABN0VD31_9ACTN